VSKVDDLIPLEDARERVHKRRKWVREFARATGTLHEPTGKIIWPEFERAFMAQRKTPRGQKQPAGAVHHLVKC
jgi:hypothetical protein